MTIVTIFGIAAVCGFFGKELIKDIQHDKNMEEIDKEILENGGEIYYPNGRRAA